MIQKAFEINKINLKKYNFYLFYGENEGYKNEIIKNKFEQLYQNQTYKYDEKEVLEKKNEFWSNYVRWTNLITTIIHRMILCNDKY